MMAARNSTPQAPPPPTPVDDWMSVPKAARAIDRAPQTVYALALQGQLEHQVVDGRVFISRASVDRFTAAQSGAE